MINVGVMLRTHHQTIITLPDLSNMQVTLRIHEMDIERIRKGMPVTVTVESAGSESFPGKITKIAELASTGGWRSDPEVKQRIREGAEKEEREFYSGRASQEWLDALQVLGTDEHKPFLETAPLLIAIFAQSYGTTAEGRSFKHYYAQESVGIATGFLIAALHHAGLATLTHTPSPMTFLNHLLDRPTNERPFLVLVVGYPAADAEAPVHATRKKGLAEFVSYV